MGHALLIVDDEVDILESLRLTFEDDFQSWHILNNKKVSKQIVQNKYKDINFNGHNYPPSVY